MLLFQSILVYGLFALVLWNVASNVKSIQSPQSIIQQDNNIIYLSSFMSIKSYRNSSISFIRLISYTLLCFSFKTRTILFSSSLSYRSFMFAFLIAILVMISSFFLKAYTLYNTYLIIRLLIR